MIEIYSLHIRPNGVNEVPDILPCHSLTASKDNPEVKPGT